MRKRQTMEIIETFGHYVENLTDKKPQSARRLLKTGWEAQNLKFRYMQDKRLMPADRHLANLMMDTMLRPLQKPEDSVIVSIFTPCEMMQEVGLHPYNVEGFSCYLSASKAERAVPWQIFTRYLYLPLMYHGIRPQRMYSMWQIS